MLLLRQWRERRGLSVRALAREAGVGFTTINRIETGRASPTLALLGRLARALHVDARDLIVKGWPERARTTTAKAAPAAKRGAKRLCVLLAGVLLGAGVVTTPSGDVLYREGRRLGTVRADGSGGVDVYSPSGERLGYGRPSPYTPGTLEFFTPDGRRGLDIRPRAPETPKRGRGR